jgi:peptidoglycan/LPS O-acetylase OafA/YrhL
VAILLVIAYHGWDYHGPNEVGRALTAVARQGWVGVDVFFAMSGFLITRILLASRDSPRYYSSFWVRRSLRIFPLYYAVLTLLVAAVLGAAAVGIELGDLTVDQAKRSWINYLYLSNFAVAWLGSNVILLDISWSLAVEEQFYLLYPVVVRRLSRRRLELAMVAAIALAIPLRWFSFRYVPGTVHGPYALPYCRMDALAVGCLAALLLERSDRSAARVVARAALPLWIAAAVTVLAFMRNELVMVLIGYLLVSAATAATILRVQLGEWAWLTRQLRRPLLVQVGKLSYGIYLLHLFVRAGVNRVPWLGATSADRNTIPVVAVRFVLIGGVGILLAWLSWRFFESKFLRLKDRLAPTGAAGRAGRG